MDLRQYTHTTSSSSSSSGIHRRYHGATCNHHNNVEGQDEGIEEDEEEEDEQVFTPEDQMRFMGSYGGVTECIAQIIGRATQRGDYLDAERLVLTGLLGAASTSNSHSLETIIRVVSAIVVEHPELYVPARVDRICMQVYRNINITI